jgi:hypothetical protein
LLDRVISNLSAATENEKLGPRRKGMTGRVL